MHQAAGANGDVNSSGLNIEDKQTILYWRNSAQ